MSTAHRSRLTPAEQSVAVREYSRGRSILSIAKSLRVDWETVHRVLVLSGVEVRGQSESNRRYTLDERAFERDDPESRYWLGFVLADGCIRVAPPGRGGTGLILGLAARDAGHLESFRSFVRGDHPIRTRPATGNTSGRGHRAATIRAYSRPLVDSLIALGVRPDKTQTAAAPPRLADDADFWRGVIDGDGCLHLRTPPGSVRYRGGWRASVGLVGTKALCADFATFARRRIGPPARGGEYPVTPSSSVWRAIVTGMQALRLSEVLYADAAVALPRKASTAAAFSSLASCL
jgi:hypothetical protein